MRKIFLWSFLLFAINTFAQTGWFWQNPLPQGHTILDIKMAGGSTIYGASFGGTILKSVNNGLNWTTTNLFGVCDSLQIEARDIFAFNANKVYVLANSYSWLYGYVDYSMIRTSNGGQSWDTVKITKSSLYGAYNKLSFINENTGYCYGYHNIDGTILKTVNAGLNWSKVSVNSNDSLSSVYFINESTGWISAANQNLLYKTTDGGASWSQINLPGRFLQLYFQNTNTGFAINKNSQQLYRTSNGGSNWSPVSNGFSNLFGMKFSDANTGYALSDSGMVKTTNSGVSWSIINHFDGYIIYNFDVSNSSIAVCGANGSILFSSDAGVSWGKAYKDISKSQNLNDVFFIDENTGWVTCFLNILKSTDGGSSWVSQDTTRNFNNIKFINSNTGYVNGGDIIGKTTNGGATWTHTEFVNYYFSNIYTLGASTVYTFGIYNLTDPWILFKSTNSGNTWSQIPLPSEMGIPCFINENTGWAIYGTQLRKTTNGGINWAAAGSVPNHAYQTYFTNENTGWLSSDSSIYKTTNGGTSWQKKFTNRNVEISSIKFINDNTGWAIGGWQLAGNIVKTTDGGETWKQNYNLNSHGLTNAHFINANTGWAIGSSGTIIKTTTGGTIGVQQISSAVPDNFSLSQNYPNPFNPNTVISYKLSAAGNVSLKVFDLLGKEVAALVNEKQSAGSYAVDFNSAEYNLPSGIYFYTLNAGDFKETRKMVLVK